MRMVDLFEIHLSLESRAFGRVGGLLLPGGWHCGHHDASSPGIRPHATWKLKEI